MEEVKVLGAWPSPFVYRVLWALDIKGVKYEYIEEDLMNKSELLLNSNPVYKKIPVLIHNGKPICESTIIFEYIDETWPHNPLLPKDPYQKAMARFWTKFCDDKVTVFAKVFLCVGEELEEGVKESKEILKIIEEQALGGNKYFGGEEIGLTDLAFGWLATGFDIFEEIVGVKVVDAESFPGLHAWIHNFRNHHLIKRNLPDDKLRTIFVSKRDMYLASKSASD
ncbi:hypothetical protein ACFE04_001404 [Oxalis oulophora]